MLTLGSLFDGVGGWQVAAMHNGIKPIWSSEIDSFCMSVTKHHFPDTVQLGDITKVSGKDIKPVDIITFGFPCTSVSVAGKQTGFEGESGLFYEAIRIIREMRDATDGRYPQYAIAENVTGLFSNKNGATFRTVLEQISESKVPMPRSGKWANAGMVRSRGCTLCWRTLSAEYWGVPQRRKRIFLVASFGNDSSAEIFFESESLPRSSSESKTAQHNTSETTRGSVDVPIYDMSHACDVIRELYKAPTLSRFMGTGGGNVPIVFADHPKHKGDMVGRLVYCENKTNALCATDWKGVGNQYVNDHKLIVQNGVRRLTPLECERLQGYEDNWTNVDFRGKSATDTPRYKAIGNGMAQPCADYVLKCIVRGSDLVGSKNK